MVAELALLYCNFSDVNVVLPCKQRICGSPYQLACLASVQENVTTYLDSSSVLFARIIG
jgi:hypothetical protein